jgi:alpha-tubulin suppressor-like RCC1 family protein
MCLAVAVTIAGSPAFAQTGQQVPQPARPDVTPAGDAPCTITSDALFIFGTPSADVICVGDGAFHVVVAGDGNDIVRGGPGVDYTLGGNGNDRIDGGGGADVVIGGLGHDICTRASRYTDCEDVLELNQLAPGVVLLPIEDKVTAADVNPGGTSRLVLVPGARVAVNDVLSSGSAPLLPDGFLGRVRTVQTASDGPHVTTDPVALRDIIPYGEFDISSEGGTAPPAPPSELPAQGGAPAPVTPRASGGKDFGSLGQSNVSCGASGKFSASIDPFLTYHLAAGAAWLPFKGDYAYFNAGAKLGGQAKLEVGAGADCTWTKSFDGPELGKIATVVGTVPVVFTINSGLELKAAISASASAEVVGTISVGIEANASDSKGTFTHSLEPSHEASFTKDVSGDAIARLDAIGKVSLRTYGLAGPELAAGPFIEAKAQFAKDPWFTLDGGVHAGLRLLFKGLGVNVDRTLVEADLVRFNILRFTGTAPPPVVPVVAASQVDAGDQYACALVAGGGVRCWGSNLDGQVGDGTTSDRATPVAVSNLSGATQIAVGDFGSCALVAGGSIKCWGYNDAGQLGDGTTTSRSVPVTVSGISGATQISAGGHHTCALVGGNVKCWGSNGFGELGDGTTTDRLAPVTVVGVSGATQISTGTNHSCAVLAGGVKCWGLNLYGALGDGTTTNRSTPVMVGGVSGAIQVSAAGRHTCALLGSGAVDCWGRNDFGELGDGTTTNRTTPVGVVGLTGASQVSAGSNGVTCALVAGGVQCWGVNGNGQLGDGSTTNRTTPVGVSGMSGATGIGVGSNHGCSLVIGGSVKCWGANNKGQLGNGAAADSPTPVAVSGLGTP